MAFHYKPKNSKMFRIAYYKDGKQYSVSANTRNESEARKKAKELTAKHNLGMNLERLIKTSDSTIKLSTAYSIFDSQRQLKKNTKAVYKYTVEHLIRAIGDKPLIDIRENDNYQFHHYLNSRKFVVPKTNKQKGLSINAKATYLRYAHAFFNFLKKKQLVQENPFVIIKPERKEVVIISPEDLQLIFDDVKNTNEEHYNIIKIKYLAALRAGELLTLTSKSFNLEKREVYIRNEKGNRNDTISMPGDLYEFLISLGPRTTQKFFPKLTYDVIKGFWSRSMKRLNFDYNIHMLRKTRGSELAEKGVTPFTLKSFMRHESIRTTEQFYISTNIRKATDEIDSKLNVTPKIDRELDREIK